MSGQTALIEEEARLRRLKLIIDSACYRLRRDVGTPHEAIDLIVETKARALDIFPDKEPQFDLIFLPRMVRLVRERWGQVALKRRQPTRALL